MKCDKCQNHLLDYVYDELDEETRDKVAVALERCPACATRLDDYKKVNEAYDSLLELEVPQKMHADLVRSARLALDEPVPWWQRFWSPSLGGVLAMASIVGAGVWVLSSGLSPSSQQPSSAASSEVAAALASSETFDEEEAAEPTADFDDTLSHRLGGDRSPPHRDEPTAAPQMDAPAVETVALDVTHTPSPATGALAGSVRHENDEERVPAEGSLLRGGGATEAADGRGELPGDGGIETRRHERDGEPEQGRARSAARSAPRERAIADEDAVFGERSGEDLAGYANAPHPQDSTSMPAAAPSARNEAFAEAEDEAPLELEPLTQRQDDSPSVFRRAMTAYDAGHYRDAIRLFRSLSREASGDERAAAQYYLGSSYYRNGDEERARSALNTYLERYPSHAYASDARAILRSIAADREPVRMQRESVAPSAGSE